MDDAAELKAKLLEALRGFETLMVATTASNGTIHARPMAVAEVDDAGEVWFITPRDAGKVDEATVESRAVVTGQDGGSYVSVSGQLDVIHDPARVSALWRPSFQDWFPEVDIDDGAVLLRLRPEIGEYWVAGGLKGVRYFFEAARAFLDGTVPREDAIEHAKVAM